MCMTHYAAKTMRLKALLRTSQIGSRLKCFKHLTLQFEYHCSLSKLRSMQFLQPVMGFMEGMQLLQQGPYNGSAGSSGSLYSLTVLVAI